MLLLVVDELESRISSLLVYPVEEEGLVRLKVRILDKECPQALDILDTQGHSHLVLFVCLLSLADQELEEVKSLLDSLTVWVTTIEHLFINFFWDRTAIFV